jgi:hypothetical protein
LFLVECAFFYASLETGRLVDTRACANSRASVGASAIAPATPAKTSKKNQTAPQTQMKNTNPYHESPTAQIAHATAPANNQKMACFVCNKFK